MILNKTIHGKSYQVYQEGTKCKIFSEGKKLYENTCIKRELELNELEQILNLYTLEE